MDDYISTDEIFDFIKILLEKSQPLSLNIISLAIQNEKGMKMLKFIKYKFSGLKKFITKFPKFFHVNDDDLVFMVNFKQPEKPKQPKTKKKKLLNSDKTVLDPETLTFPSYLKEVSKFISINNFLQLIKVIKTKNSPISLTLSKILKDQIKDGNHLKDHIEEALHHELSKYQGPDWEKLIYLHLLVLIQFYTYQYKLAVQNQNEMIKLMASYIIQVQDQIDTFSLIPIWRTIISDARWVSIKAENSIEEDIEEDSFLVSTLNVLRPLQKPLEKSHFYISLLNTLCRIYIYVC